MQENLDLDIQMDSALPHIEARACLKLDQGFKAVLRAFRSFLAFKFNCSRHQKGHHHWLKSGNEDKWFERVTEFLEEMEIQVSTKKEVAIIILLIFPAFGLLAHRP